MTIFVLIVFVVLVSFFMYYFSFFLWITAKGADVNISLGQLFMIRLRNIPPSVIVQAMIEAHKANLTEITLPELEAHCLAGGNVERVVRAMVIAKKANYNLDFRTATAVDLAGRDVLQEIENRVSGKHKDKIIKIMMDTLIKEGVTFDECAFSKTESKIPRDENGEPIGTPWEVICEKMYENLSKHYGVNLHKL